MKRNAAEFLTPISASDTIYRIGLRTSADEAQIEQGDTHMPDFRRGADAIAKAQEKAKSGGTFRPFTPSLFWKDDGDEKYLLFLNPLADIPTVEMISFIPVVQKKGDGTKYTSYEQVIARTDSAIGEDEDPMVSEWDGKPRETCVAVAVELEPTFEEVVKGDKTYKRPTGFEVKTTTFERRIRDDDGELTDDTEEVEAPAVGFITQSPTNFFNVVTSFDSNTAPIEDTAVRITRVGKDTSTVYSIDGFEDLEIDLAGLVDCVDGISYLSEDERDALLDKIENTDDAEAGQIIGAVLLDKRLEELIDKERYDELYDGIDSTLDKFGGGKKKGKKSGGSRRERPARRSQRRSRSEEPSDEPEADTPEAEVEAQPEEKPARQRRSRSKPKDDAPAESEADEKPARRGKQADPKALNKLDELRQRQANRKAATAA
jgi:hypothetical protein